MISGYLKWFQIKCSNFCWLRNVIHVKYYRRICDIYREVYFSQKNVYKLAKHGFAIIYLSQKESPW